MTIPGWPGNTALMATGFSLTAWNSGAFGGRFLVTGKLGGLTEEAVEPVVNLEITGKGIDLAAIPLGELFPGSELEERSRPLPGGEISKLLFMGLLSRLQEQRPAGGNRRYDRGMGIRCPDRGILLNGTRLTAGLTLEESTGGRGVLTGWWEPESGCYYGEAISRSLELRPEWLGPAAAQFPGGLSGETLRHMAHGEEGRRTGRRRLAGTPRPLP